MAYLLASRLKSRDAKPEGAKVRLKSGHASRLHHASVIIKGKMLNGHYGKSSCKNFLHGIFFASSGYLKSPQGTYLIRLKRQLH